MKQLFNKQKPNFRNTATLFHLLKIAATTPSFNTRLANLYCLVTADEAHTVLIRYCWVCT